VGRNGRVLFKIFRHLTGETKENHKLLVRIAGFSPQIRTSHVLEYNSEALPLEPVCSVASVSMTSLEHSDAGS
jgi:hypothetical protein